MEDLKPLSSRPALLIGVVGTNTEVGKTWVASRLLAALKARGLRVAARKPVQSYEPDSLATWNQKSLGAASLIDRMSFSRAVLPTRTIIPSGLAATRAICFPCQIPESGSVGPGGPLSRTMLVHEFTYLIEQLVPVERALFDDPTGARVE